MSERRASGHTGRRQRAKTLPLLIGAALTTLALAQEPQAANRLYLDHAEWDYEEGGIPIPIVHLYDEPALEDCLANAAGGDCVDRALHRLPFIPVQAAEEAAEELAQAYRDLRRGVAESVDAEINNGPACHAFTICMPGSIPAPIPDPGCLLPRTMLGLSKGLAEHLPTYYAAVERVLNTYLGSHIRSGSVYPAIDSVVAPTMDITGGLDELLGELTDLQGLDDALANAYRLQSLSAFLTGYTPNIPHLADQVEYERRAGHLLALPGYRDYEAGKRNSESLHDPDRVNLNAGLFGASLQQHVPASLADDINDHLTPNATAGDVAARILAQHLEGLVPADVITNLATRVQATVDNATTGEDLELSISRSLENGIKLMAPTLYTEAATSQPLARALGWQAPQAAAAPPFEVGDALTMSNPFLYEHIGYAGFTQVTSDDQQVTLLHWDGFEPVPGMRVKCFGVVPTPFKIPMPTPAVLPGVARATYITVPEGYEIPETTQQLTPSPIATTFR